MARTKGDVVHEMLFGDTALVYRWMETPEGEGLRLDRQADSTWLGDDGRRYQTIEDAKAVYAGMAEERCPPPDARSVYDRVDDDEIDSYFD